MLEVLAQTIGMSHPPVVGEKLSALVTAGSGDKLGELFRELARRGAVFDWSINVDTPGGVSTLRFSGTVVESGYVVTATCRDEDDEHFLEAILETTPNIVYIFDLEEARFVYLNSVLARVLGVNPADPLKLGPREQVLGGERLGPSGHEWAEIMRADDEQIMEREYRVVNAEGEERLLASREKVFARDSDGVPRQILGIASDITERRRVEDALRESEESYRLQFAENSSVMLLVDPVDGRIVQANAAAERFYGYPAERLTGTRMEEISESTAEELRAARATISFEHGGRFSQRHRLADGSVRDVDVSSSRIRFAGRPLLHSIVHDVTERTRLQAELENYATTDSLTQAANRRGFLERATHERDCAIRHGRPLTLVTMDLDNLKVINDTYGHAAGDAALVAFAQVCRDSVRVVDLVARFGGDEFVLLLPETDAKGGREVAERIQAALKDIADGPDETPLQVGACAGVASLISGHESLDQLLSRADAALYRAKDLGRGGIEIAP